jgi:hypothetical protein
VSNTTAACACSRLEPVQARQVVTQAWFLAGRFLTGAITSSSPAVLKHKTT